MSFKIWAAHISLFSTTAHVVFQNLIWGAAEGLVRAHPLWPDLSIFTASISCAADYWESRRYSIIGVFLWV